MISKKIIIFMTLILLISGCSSTNTSNIRVKSYANNDIGINLNYPEKWVVTDKFMGAGAAWLVIGEKEFIVMEGNQWPFVNIFGFKPRDMSIISDRLEKLNEVNKGKEVTKSTVKINGRKYMKYETDELSNEQMKGKMIFYVLEEKDIAVLIETIEINKDLPKNFKNEIKEIINSIKIKE
ncbi:hypothetical protein [Paenibacillus xylanexedens]|uniref:hypothetical protein n=1 Tax=Paenibacillus xylanexedens TaxID=528191 RepID=UPI0011A7C3B0|nr:hypothetical protein [Paenibacillus xylanexedens]